MRYISVCTKPYEMQFDMASMTTIKNIHTVEKTIISDRCGQSFMYISRMTAWLSKYSKVFAFSKKK